MRSKHESMTSYIQRFLLTTREYLNLTNFVRASDESQNLTMVLLSNDSLSKETFASVMERLVSTTKIKKEKAKDQVSIRVDRANKVIELLTKFNTTGEAHVRIVEDRELIQQCAKSLKATVSRRHTLFSDSVLKIYIYIYSSLMP